MSLLIPERFIDISRFRQVPDNQEVFVETDSNDASIIVEIVQPPESKEDYDHNAEYYFWELLDIKDPTTEAKIFHSESPVRQKIGPQEDTRECEMSFVEGVTPEGVNIKLALIRIAGLGTDVLITMNRCILEDFAHFIAMAKTFKILSWDILG